MRHLSFVLLLYTASQSQAGLHYSKEATADLPAQWRGFLLDHRMLRGIGIAQTPKYAASVQREQYEMALKSLFGTQKARMLTPDESADMAAVLIRLNRVPEALELLRIAVRRHPDHFALASNLGTAWQLAGDLGEADSQLGEAVRLAPARWKPFEEAHRKLVQLRRKASGNRDDLFAIPFTDAEGRPSPERISAEQFGKLPANDVAIVQQLALWLPADGLLLWQLAELANAHGDVQTAAGILEGCVSEFALGTGDIRERRRTYRAAADATAKLPDSEHNKHRGNIVFASVRPFIRRLDTAKLPAIRKDGVNGLPWDLLAETTVAKPFKPKYADYLEKLDGLHVTLTGYPFSATPGGELNSFLLVEFPVGCWFCESPEPVGIVRIELMPGTTTDMQRQQVRIEGKLKLNRDDAEDYLFSLTDGKIKPTD